MIKSMKSERLLLKMGSCYLSLSFMVTGGPKLPRTSDFLKM